MVGAGPGDAGLLTLKGKEALQSAEAVVYDWLVNPKLLELAPAPEKIFVGKKGGTYYREQGEINRILLRLAKKGKLVVRLKGGDPFIFGRGGEEADFLARKKIDFEVIPGVSAGIGVPAYAGIPLTDRRFASHVTFVTGHEDPTKKSAEVDWRKLGALGGTLVSFMGVKNLQRIVRALRDSGKSPQTPVAVVEWGTLPSQRVVVGTLKDIVRKCKQARLESPALTIVGEVVKLRQRLDWFQKKPLQGKKIVVTRARAQASDLVRSLSEKGAEVLEFPTIEILPPSRSDEIDREIRRLSDYDWVIFTSVNGVRFFFGRVRFLGKDSRIFASTRIAAIGEKTAEALQEKGLRADLVPDDFTSRALFESLRAKNLVRGKKFLLGRADIAPPDLCESLKKEGADVVEIEVYRTHPQFDKQKLFEWLGKQGVDFVTFTSSSTVRNFFEPIPPSMRKKLRTRFVTIGPVTSRTLREYGFRPFKEAKVHTIEGLVETLSNGGQEK